MVWTAGQSQWLPVYQVPELNSLVQEIPPEPPTTKKEMPKTWLVESILVTILCCLPFGIAGIVNATKVDSLYLSGNYEQAQIHSNNARKWIIWSLASAVIFWLLYLLVIVFIAFSASSDVNY